MIAFLHISDKRSNQLSIYHAPIRQATPDPTESAAPLQGCQLEYRNEPENLWQHINFSFNIKRKLSTGYNVLSIKYGFEIFCMNWTVVCLMSKKSFPLEPVEFRLYFTQVLAVMLSYINQTPLKMFIKHAWEIKGMVVFTRLYSVLVAKLCNHIIPAGRDGIHYFNWSSFSLTNGGFFSSKCDCFFFHGSKSFRCIYRSINDFLAFIFLLETKFERTSSYLDMIRFKRMSWLRYRRRCELLTTVH